MRYLKVVNVYDVRIVSGVELMLKSLPMRHEMRLHRPFMFSIMNKKTGVQLFTGVLTNPLVRTARMAKYTAYDGESGAYTTLPSTLVLLLITALHTVLLWK